MRVGLFESTIRARGPWALQYHFVPYIRAEQYLTIWLFHDGDGDGDKAADYYEWNTQPLENLANHLCLTMFASHQGIDS